MQRLTRSCKEDLIRAADCVWSDKLSLMHVAMAPILFHCALRAVDLERGSIQRRSKVNFHRTRFHLIQQVKEPRLPWAYNDHN